MRSTSTARWPGAAAAGTRARRGGLLLVAAGITLNPWILGRLLASAGPMRTVSVLKARV